jgi:hypothetical protein
MTKSMIDGGMIPGECSDADAAACLAQGHPKAQAAPISYGMRDRTSDGDGPDDDARKQSFEKGGDCPLCGK